MLLGYARVSKADGQDTAAQVTVLKATFGHPPDSLLLRSLQNVLQLRQT